MSDKQKSPRKAGSPLSLRQLVPAGWHEDRPAYAGDPFFDWESKPEPPRHSRELRFAESPRSARRTHA
ncbi:MAG: hypothetical protein ACOY93_16285 [Bacillota bacterium]